MRDISLSFNGKQPGVGVMWRGAFLTAAWSVLFPAVASAATMVAIRPGLMCTSATALGALTLPNGSSRTSGSHERPGDATLKQQGGCIDIPLGARVLVQARRRNTTIVMFDSGNGHGSQTYVTPNIDYAFSGPTSSPSAECLSYDTQVTLDGIITTGSAYGEDIHTGKVSWSHWKQITFTRPICFIANNKYFEDAAQNVKASQYYSDKDDLAEILKVGAHVLATGSLSQATTAEWMTPIIFDLTRVTYSR
jgi:hypothetical protein